MFLKALFRVGMVLALMVALSAASPVMAGTRVRPLIDENAPAVPGEMIVMFQAGTPLTEVERAAAQMGATVGEYNPEMGAALFLLGAPQARVTEEAAFQAMDASAAVLTAEPNYIMALGDTPVGSFEEPERPTSIMVQATDVTTGQQFPMEIPLPAPDEERDPEVVAALAAETGEPIEILSTTLPNDAATQWGWFAIQADVVWKDTTVAYEVAVLDTGIANTHPDLAARFTMGKDYVNNDTLPIDDHGHGTHVAGIIAAIINNNKGIAGVSNGRIFVIKVLDAQGRGSLWDVAQGIYDSANRSTVKVINISAGYSTTTGSPPAVLQNALQYAVVDKGKLVVVAAGNDDQQLMCDDTGAGYDVYPACFRATSPFDQKMIVVAGAGFDLDSNGQIARFPADNFEEEQRCKSDTSNYSENFVDIAAPGTMIYSTLPLTPVDGGSSSPFYSTTGYGTLTGTSMAAPHVAAAAARVWAETPTLTNVNVKNELITRALSSMVDVECGASPWPGAEPPYLWLAGAMQEAAIQGFVYDAYSGAPLPSTTVQARRGATVVASDVVCKTADCAEYWLRAIKVDLTKPVDIWFYRAGYTSSYQKYYTNLTISTPGYLGINLNVDRAMLPPTGARWSFIVTWFDPDQHEIDGYVFLPTTVPSGVGWVGAQRPYGDSGPNTTGTIGDLSTEPRARLMYDNGYYKSWALPTPPVEPPYDDALDLAPSNWYFGADTLAIQKNVSTMYYVGNYVLIAANNWTSGGGVPTTIANITGVCAHVWNAGVLTYRNCLPPGDPDQFWVVGKINGTTFTAIGDVTNTPETYTDGNRVFSDFVVNGLMSGPIPIPYQD